MRKLITVAVAGLAFAAAFSGGDAEARPKYKGAFEKKYPKVGESNKIDCSVCHPGKEKKEKNNYGDALGKVVSKNEADEKKIEEALGKIESEKSAVEGKTFGDLLKDGKLPASK